MNNFYIAFAVYLNLIFIAAKLWDRIQWSWGWVMAPLIVMTVIGAIASVGQAAQKRRLRNNLTHNLRGLRTLIDDAKATRRDADSIDSHTSGERH